MSLKLSETPLSYGTKNYNVAQLHQALEALGRYIPDSEKKNQVVGPGTLAIFIVDQQDAVWHIWQLL